MQAEAKQDVNSFLPASADAMRANADGGFWERQTGKTRKGKHGEGQINRKNIV
jgi:hypothetical protein